MSSISAFQLQAMKLTLKLKRSACWSSGSTSVLYHCRQYEERNLILKRNQLQFYSGSNCRKMFMCQIYRKDLFESEGTHNNYLVLNQCNTLRTHSLCCENKNKQSNFIYTIILYGIMRNMSLYATS